jgi:hypothetical protein
VAEGHFVHGYANTIPQTISVRDLEEKYRAGSEKSLINIHFT